MESNAVYSENSVISRRSAHSSVVEGKTYLDRVADICRGHLMISRRYEDEQERLSALSEKMNGEVSEFEAVLIQDSINEIKGKMTCDRETMAVFERMLLSLNEIEKNVITQLYLEGKRWADVRGLDGTIVCASSVSSIRRRALGKMAKTLAHIDRLRDVNL